MKLKANIVERDESGAVIKSTPISKQAIVVDDKHDTCEVLSCDVVEIERFTYARDRGVFQVQLVLGGYDSKGNFWRDLRYGEALVSWSRDQYPQMWATYDLEHLKALDLDIVKQWLHSCNAIAMAGNNVWGITKVASALYDDDDKLVDGYKIKPKDASAVLEASH